MKRVLTPEELERLLAIPTKVAEAKRIGWRYLGLLRAIERDDWMYDGRHGCPHCEYRDGAFHCGQCRWTRGTTRITTCLQQTFGGVSNADTCIGLGPLTENLIRPYDEDEKQKSITYCLGHIEWAGEIIKRAQKGEDGHEHDAADEQD